MRRKSTLAVAIAFIVVLLQACSASLPDEAKAVILRRYEPPMMYANTVRNVQIVVKGSGQPLPFERQYGVDTIICVTVHFEYGWPDLSYGATPTAVSGLAEKTGNSWQWLDGGLKGDWDAHSCSGTYESSSGL
jgi:hypothetical protein